MKRIILFLLLLLSIQPLAFSDLQLLNRFPLKVGEKMTFSVKILGIYIGDQIANLDKISSYQGRKILVGAASLKTTDFISKLYTVDDHEVTFFTLERFIPLYYEKWVNEGNWHDHIQFYFNPGAKQMDYFAAQNNNQKVNLSFEESLRNYFTLIFSVRALDYQYYIDRNVPVEIDYLLGTSVKKSLFKVSRSKMRRNDKDIDIFFLQEQGGIGLNFKIQDNLERIPLELTIPAYKVIGYKTIDIYVELKEYKAGDGETVYTNP